MKNNKAVLFIAATLLFTLAFIQTSCNDDIPDGYSKKSPPKRTIFDTTKTIAVFPTTEKDNIIHDIVYKIRLDSVETLIDLGEGKFQKLWANRDSIYYLPKAIPVIDSVTKKPALDSAGKQKYRIEYVGPFDKAFVWDSNINVDSARRRFEKFVSLDTAIKK